MTKALATLAVLAVAGLAIAGCGSSNSSSSTTTSSESAYGGSSSEGRYGSGSKTASASPEATGAAVVSAATTPKLGKVLVDPKGFTLYLFKKDKGTTSSCYGPCAKFWPPLMTEGKPQAGEGAMASKLGTTMRKEGTEQVTYAGHPLYTYVEDKKPGDTTGNDVNVFGGQWYALFPSGEQAGH
jgi:predicted lipoprotein with Yx(FWY)xxD motif